MAREDPADPRGLAGDPSRETPGASATLDSAARPETAAGRVLVIDDFPAMLNLVSSILRHAGYAVEEASDGLEGLQRLRETPPDLVVTDLQMPGASGWDVARAAAMLRPPIPVILMTGAAEDVRANPQGRALVEAVLLKPFGMKEVIEAVRRHIGNGAAAASATAPEMMRPAASAAMLSGT
jgi:CheY-like chemotaxis protein